MKYAVLLLAVMFVGCDEAPSTEEAPSTDGGYETFTFDADTMQIAKADCPSDMSWNDAMAACQNLGNGWRLPNKDELAAMYNQLHTKGKGNFRTDGFYWSSSESNADNAWNFSFNSGVANDFIARDKGYSFHVRAVRAKP